MAKALSSNAKFSLEQADLTRLRQSIIDAFDENELRTLTFDLEIDYESLPAIGKAGKARELVDYCKRNRSIQKLLNVCAKERPHIPWHTFVHLTADIQSPFKGLRYYDVEDASLFFGREALIKKLVDSLLPNPSQFPAKKFLAIVGASGSGKSSLVRAGLVPAIRLQTDWQIYVITPTAHPLEALAEPLTRDVNSLNAFETLIDDFSRSSCSLHLATRRHLSRISSECLLLVIDQFEELFTECKDEGERKAFVDNLLEAVAPETSGSTIAGHEPFLNKCLDPFAFTVVQKRTYD